MNTGKPSLTITARKVIVWFLLSAVLWLVGCWLLLALLNAPIEFARLG